MAWIESHQELARHPKVLRLARILKVNKAQAIGHLHLLWWWTLDYSPTGELSAFTSCELGLAAEWTGDGDGFRKALRESGFLDESGNIHDWHDYAGKLVEQREADRQRKRLSRARPPDVHRTSAGIPPDGGQTAGVPNPTVPNRTEAAQPPNRGRARAPALAEVLAAAELRGYPPDETERFWNHFEASGWIDRNGHPIAAWEPKLANWIADARARPAERAHHAGSQGVSPSMQASLDKSELERVEKRVIEILNSYEGHQEMSPKHKTEISGLRKRRGELKERLGFSV